MDTIRFTLAFIDGLGAPEMMLIFVIVLVLFGGQKLPEFARGLGKSIREFKKAAAGVEEEFKRALEEDERKNAQAKLAAPTTPAPVEPVADQAGPDAQPSTPVTEEPAMDVTTPVAPETSGAPETEESKKPAGETITPTILPPNPKPPASSANQPAGNHPDFP